MSNTLNTFSVYVNMSLLYLAQSLACNRRIKPSASLELEVSYRFPMARLQNSGISRNSITLCLAGSVSSKNSNAEPSPEHKVNKADIRFHLTGELCAAEISSINSEDGLNDLHPRSIRDYKKQCYGGAH